METELKLLIESSDAEALRQHPLLKKYASAPPHEQALSGIYFDTPNYDLKRADAGLRVRPEEKNWVQTLKVDRSTVGGLHRHQEWESRVDGPAPNLAALRERIDPKSSYAKLLKKLNKLGALKPTFTTQVTRTIWELQLPEGDEIECVIDQGSFEYGASKAPISEVELELKSGKLNRLFDLALQLQRDVPMHMDSLSQADRGYDLVLTGEIAAVKAAPIRLNREMTVEAAFQAIVENCLSHVQANEPGVTKAHDIESVHQMRVGLRRLRSALGMFETVIPCPDEIQAELRWLGTELGAARDWDVLAGPTLAKVEKELADKTMLDPVRKMAQERAAANHERAAEAVLSPRYTKLMLVCCSWVEGAGWRRALTEAQRGPLDSPIRRFADKTLVRDQERLLKRGNRLRGADPATRHRVRIAAKKTRYATEFFQTLYPARRVGPYVKALSQLQDELGSLNDAAVATTLLQGLETARPDIASNASFVRGYLTGRTNSDDIALESLWKKFRPLALPCQRRLR